MGNLAPIISFDFFEVRLELGELRRHGHRIKLQDKPFQILAALLERPGELVSREELRRRLWSDATFVDFDHNLNNAVEKLRKALNDSSEQPRFIETLPKRGYRFIAPVETPAAESHVDPQPTPAQLPFVQSADLHQLASPGSANSVPASLSLPVPNAYLPPGATSGTRRIVFAAVAALWVLGLFASIRSVGLQNPMSAFGLRPVPSIRSFAIEQNDALDPTEEGFQLVGHGHFDWQVVRNAANSGFDRIRFLSDDQAYFYRTLTPAEKRFALTHDWKLICVCAVEKGAAEADILFGSGSPRFDLQLLQEGDKYFVALTNAISPSLQWETKVEFPGANDTAHPHTFELHFDHSTQTASLWIDGRLSASGYRGYSQYLEDRGLLFGSYSYLSEKTGVGVFRSIRFEAH